MRIPAEFLTDKKRYLSTYNFVTNLVLFCEGPERHTRMVSANYWAGYGAKNVRAWLRLFAADGTVLATWEEKLPEGVAAFVVDSRDVAKRFGLGAFEGQLFIHMIDVTGHDVLKYALDFWSGSELTCTHDANPWPSDYYAGIPAPRRGRARARVGAELPFLRDPGRRREVLGDGNRRVGPDDRADPGFRHARGRRGRAAARPCLAAPDRDGCRQVRRAAALRGRARRQAHVAHANVERSDLKPDPQIATLGADFGKGFILPAPILPQGEYTSVALPTPMARGQASLPLVARFYDASGAPAGEKFLGNLARDHACAVETDGLKLASGYGHMELSYDFRDGGAGDGWIHALFRYARKNAPAHGADTSFGSHIFNTALVFKNEPQSYIGRPPGLTTRLFLRLGADGHDALCHLIYPASTPWHATSDTALELHDASGTKIAESKLAIPCSGSKLWRAGETFSAADLGGPATAATC